MRTQKMIHLRSLQKIPGVGPSIAQDLYDLGIEHIIDLKDGNPEQLYQQLCVLRGQHIDRCVLYVFRCAIYYASQKIMILSCSNGGIGKINFV